MMEIINMSGFRLKVVILFLLFPTLLTTLRCQHDVRGTIDWDFLTKMYSKKPSDSLRLQALTFLKENMEGMTSEIVGLKNPLDDSTLYLNQIDRFNYGKDSLRNLIKKNGYIKVRYVVNDVELISTQKLKKNIDDAFQAWEHSASFHDTPKDIFFNYLLPYKIFEEYPSDWRAILAKSIAPDYKKWESDFQIKYNENKIVYIDTLVNKFILPQNEKWFQYSLNGIRIGKVPSFDEIAIQRTGDCFSEAAINTYLIRANGIPAGYDFVPYWGNTNGSHATATYWNAGNQKMRLLFGLDYAAAKVFRRTFRNYKMWDEEIKPVIKENPFSLDFLKTNYILDVTKDHVKTSTLFLDIPEWHSLDYVYIDILSYDSWKPIFWAKVENNKAIFKDMGRGVIYRVEIPDKNNISSYGIPFLLTDSGKIVHPKVSTKVISNVILRAVNAGKEAYVKAGHSYLLSYMDQKGEWIPIGVKKCLEDSVIKFHNIRNATFYKLLNYPNERNLSRIFSLKSGQQSWH